MVFFLFFCIWTTSLKTIIFKIQYEINEECLRIYTIYLIFPYLFLIKLILFRILLFYICINILIY